MSLPPAAPEWARSRVAGELSDPSVSEGGARARPRVRVRLPATPAVSEGRGLGLGAVEEAVPPEPRAPRGFEHPSVP